MIESFILLVIVIVVNFTVNWLVPTFDFLTVLQPYMPWAIGIAAAIFALFVIVSLFKTAFKK